MIRPARFLCSLLSLIASCTLLAGCSTLSRGGDIRETELAITPTESSVSFSRTAQEDIAQLNLTAERLGNPSDLEEHEQVAALPLPARRSLLISEAWHLRGQNELEVPLSVSLERFLRAAHFSYEGIFGESGCEDMNSQLCKDLTNAYNRSVREIARLTNNGTRPPAPGDSRYIVDLQADNDPLTLSEWEVTFDNNQTTTPSGALGAAGTGCQELAHETSGHQGRARQCIPLVFLVTFEDRVTNETGRAHLSALNTLGRSEIQLHGRVVALATQEQGPWTEIFTPSSDTTPLTCLGDGHAALPTTIFLTPSIPASYEWSVIGAAVANDPLIREHYNLCSLNLAAVEHLSAQDQVAGMSGALTTLLPGGKPPAHIILIAQGAQGDGVLKTLKGAFKDIAPGATAPLAISGSLSFLAAVTSSNSAPPIPISSPSELSRAGTVALADIKRMLTKLANEEDGMFGAVSRSTISPSAEGRLSPVM